MFLAHTVEKLKKNVYCYIQRLFYVIHFYQDTILQKWANFWMAKNFEYDVIKKD